MKRYVNYSIACATAALVGVAAAGVSAQQTPPAGRQGGNGQGAQQAQPAQPAPQTTPARGRGNRGNMEQGASAPAGGASTTVGSVRIPRAGKADGQNLASGTYQIRVTEREASPAAPGQTPQYERWAEFLQGGQVKGREVVTVVPQADIAQIAEDRPPRAGSCRTDVLKGNEYYRIWCNRGGNHYLVHLNIS